MFKSLNIRSALIITAATIGSGVFALPYVVAQVGWLTTIIYFVILGTLVVTAHAMYLKTLQEVNEKERLLGLARKYFGATGFWIGFFAIVIGLLLSFVIYLILGTQFIRLIIPSLPYYPALFIMWLLIAIPAVVSNRREVKLALAGVLAVTAIIIFICSTSTSQVADLRSRVGTLDFSNLFFPFSFVLFALAGWTGVEPFYERWASYDGHLRREDAHRKMPIVSLALGTGLATLLYLMFASGIIASVPHVASDTISSLTTWPIWKRDLIALLGLFAIGTCSGPISHEIRNALEKDLHWPKIVSRLIVVGLPLIAVLLGFNSFLLVVGIAGGIFLAVQYLLIIAVAHRTLTLNVIQKFLLDLVALAFLAAAIYEIASFIVK